MLAALRSLVHEDGPRQTLRERDELHRMLEQETWVFGEEYASLLSEPVLTEVLRRDFEPLRGGPVPRPAPDRAG